MPTFNANRAMTAASKKIDKLSDQLAFEIRERLQDPVSTNDDMIAFMKAMLDAARSKESARQLIAGTFAQSNSGQPAAQLGAGQGGGTQPSPAPITPQEALQVIASDPRFTQVGVLLQRVALGIQSPGNPAAVEVDANGDDRRLKPLRDNLAEVEAARDDARRERADAEAARDQAVANLATARDGWVEKSALLPLVEAVATAAGGLSTSVFSSIVEGKDALDTAVAAAKAAVS